MTDARINAAARKLAEIRSLHFDAMDGPRRTAHRDAAAKVLAAADAVSASECEKLRAALEHASMVMRAARIPASGKLPNTATLLRLEADVIDDLLAARALVGSVPPTQSTKETG